MTMGPKFFKCLFHLVVTAACSYAAYREFILEVGHDGLFGKFRFLTFWNICFQTVYFGICLIIDVSGAKRNFLPRWRDAFHACVVFPGAVFVFVTFWGLYAVDRELVLPKAMDAYFPAWLNHMVHTAILPFILMEKMVSNHIYPRRRRGLIVAICVFTCYQIIIVLEALINNVWVYKTLEVLSWFHRVLFLLGCTACICLYYVIGEKQTKYIWGKGRPLLDLEHGETFKGK